MDYFFSKTVDLPFDEAVKRTTEVLKTHGFGVLTEIDVRATLKEKLDVDFRNYRILGACNPPNAYKALRAEPKIGLLMPCNVIVEENEGGGGVEVSGVDPLASMSSVDNPELAGIAGEVREMMKKAISEI